MFHRKAVIVALLTTAYGSGNSRRESEETIAAIVGACLRFLGTESLGRL